MTNRKEALEKEIPVGNLEKLYQKQTEGVLYSNILQIPSTVTSDMKGSPAPLRKGRMVLRDADFPVECSWLATGSMSLSHSCKFGLRLPIICRKQSQAQHGMYGQLAQSCTAVFLN
jgi:pentatricopeptide repeat domain-containing protein 1